MAEEIIRLEDVAVFQKEILVLSGVCLTVRQGEFVYLKGRTGSGKSSLLKTLYADLPLRDGHARVAGFDLRNLKLSDIPMLRRSLGIVFQDFQLFPDRTVADNLLFVMKATGWSDKSKMKARIDELLGKTGLHTKGFKMPHQLSGGEQQRVGVARALINSPKIILADEPTGNLDPESSEGILSLLTEISNSGTAVVMATHNYRLIRRFPGRVLRVEHGRLYEETTEITEYPDEGNEEADV